MALVEDLLTAAAEGQDAAALAERLVALDREAAVAALDALGHSRNAAAAPILSAIAEGGANASKELRKAARRELHRLRAVGIEVPRAARTPALLPFAERPAVLVEAWTTAADGVGSRALWLTAERALGGVYGVALILNDMVGMKGCSVDETTRKRFAARFEDWRRSTELTVVQLPVEYPPQLVGEALELNRESGFTIPREWLVHQRTLANLVRPFERAIVYDEIPAAEVALRPDLLEGSPSLLDEEELKGWFFGFDEVRKFARDLRQARQSQIVLTEDLQARRLEGIVANAIREVVTPVIQRGLTRRLEEVAYVFLRTGRGRQARLAMAAARRLGEGAITLHPLLIAMTQKSLELAAEAETAKVPIHHLRRSPYDPIE